MGGGVADALGAVRAVKRVGLEGVGAAVAAAEGEEVFFGGEAVVVVAECCGVPAKAAARAALALRLGRLATATLCSHGGKFSKEAAVGVGVVEEEEDGEGAEACAVDETQRARIGSRKVGGSRVIGLRSSNAERIREVFMLGWGL